MATTYHHHHHMTRCLCRSTILLLSVVGVIFNCLLISVTADDTSTTPHANKTNPPPGSSTTIKSSGGWLSNLDEGVYNIVIISICVFAGAIVLGIVFCIFLFFCRSKPSAPLTPKGIEILKAFAHHKVADRVRDAGY